MSKRIYLKSEMKLISYMGAPCVHRSGAIYVLVYFLRLRPTDSLSDSLPFETGRYTYIHGLSFFSPHFLHCFSLLLPFSPFPSLSISVFSKLYRREIYFRPSRAKPLSPTLSASSNSLLSSYSHTLIHFPRRSYSLHPIWGPPRSPIFAVEHTWMRLEERPRRNKESAIGKKR